MAPAAVIEFLLWLPIAASLIGLVTKRPRVPYALRWVVGLVLFSALLFGALISATDLFAVGNSPVC